LCLFPTKEENKIRY